MRGGISWVRTDGKPVEKTDNTAKIFPVIANENVSQVFRISVTLKEPVDPELLSRALEEILPEIRNFQVKMRRDFSGIILRKMTGSRR
ncbi:MAG: hypothetical protein ACLUD2_16710 [Clostridium sp.]